MISTARAREVLAKEGVELPDEKLAMLLEDLQALARVLVSSYRQSRSETTAGTREHVFKR